MAWRKVGGAEKRMSKPTSQLATRTTTTRHTWSAMLLGYRRASYWDPGTESTVRDRPPGEKGGFPTTHVRHPGAQKQAESRIEQADNDATAGKKLRLSTAD